MKDVFKGAREVLWVNIGERGYGGKFDDIEDGVRGEIWLQKNILVIFDPVYRLISYLNIRKIKGLR